MRYFSALGLATFCTGLALAASAQVAQPGRTSTPAAAKPATSAKPAAPKPTAAPAPSKPAAPAKTSGTAPASAKPATSATTPPAKAPAAAPKPASTAPAKPTGPPLPANMGSTDLKTRYKNGKTLLDQTRYDLAMQELEPLTAPGNKFERAPEAAYLYAVAASRAKKWAEAEQMLNLLRSEYAQWPNLPEAFFLQGQVSFEQGDFENGLRVLAQLPPDLLSAQVANMKARYLSRVKDKATFQSLLKTYPQDAVLGRAFAEKLANGGWYTDADRGQLDQLITQFSLDRTRFTPRPRVLKKTSYNIAVLLPFEFSDPSWETRRKNQFVTDLYAGLRLAQDSLQREGRPVQLFAYDTGADTLQLKQVLALPELASMDMLIGPVYKSGSKILARYAQQKQITCVNPLSQDGDLVLDNSWHYLFEPSTATQARQAAQFAYSRLGGTRTAVVLYEDTKDEAAFGQAYKLAYEALGGRVLQLRRINSDVEESLAAGFAGVDLKSIGHLVVASDAKKAGPYTLGALKTQDARPPLITYSSWLDNNRIGLGRLDARDVYFVHPKFLDRASPGVRRFRQLYMQRQNLPPSVFAFTGFELLYYFGSQLHQNGTAFQQNLAASGPVSGTVFQGIGYPGGAHDNQYVPLTKLERLEVEVLNPVGLR
ncbi:ABC transporter substrate-binding protein [Hymenobacter psychrotolerans]|uniref:ABC-type branched-chain amino acid transport system, substrate-binding protein n=1 Tax=Hymenobacter psychrotolerans DSM 18569 TaxID=1121959 RepID=A0A1M6V6G4_9BACT|nr:ABC transporter substrate-binding protein [Hymenobacter psychrotolerans]SHK77063.1 ABC-type branched-chain amino acid transport system, substrate-binding protein [Hymenobacter psychrotolerans DSM 18569]